jgi:hypothetical protein
MKTLRDIDPVYLTGGVIALALIAMNAPSQLSAMNRQRELAQEITQQNQELQIKARLANADSERRSELAAQRYRAGCQMVVATNDPSKFAAIQQDKPVLDGTTGAPLGDGTVVCDLTGQTAVIKESVASELAFSTDRQVIRDAMKRYGNVQYSAPGQ